MNVGVARRLLTFSEVDDLALGHELGTLDSTKISGRWLATDLGPLVEFHSLEVQQRVPTWFADRHLTISPRLATLVARLQARQSFTPLHGSDDCGVFCACSAQDGDQFTAFKLAAMKAAEAAGFQVATARQLSAAMGELRSNVIEHSEAPDTGAICFAWQPGRFEFASVDRGIGVLASLRTGQEFATLTDHGTALQIATSDGRSRYGSGSGRGNGFRDLFLGLMNHRGDLRFRSGDHALELIGSANDSAEACIAQKAHLGGFAVTVSCSPAL